MKCVIVEILFIILIIIVIVSVITPQSVTNAVSQVTPELTSDDAQTPQRGQGACAHWPLPGETTLESGQLRSARGTGRTSSSSQITTPCQSGSEKLRWVCGSGGGGKVVQRPAFPLTGKIRWSGSVHHCRGHPHQCHPSHRHHHQGHHGAQHTQSLISWRTWPHQRSSSLNRKAATSRPQPPWAAPPCWGWPGPGIWRGWRIMMRTEKRSELLGYPHWRKKRNWQKLKLKEIVIICMKMENSLKKWKICTMQRMWMMDMRWSWSKIVLKKRIRVDNLYWFVKRNNKTNKCFEHV